MKRTEGYLKFCSAEKRLEKLESEMINRLVDRKNIDLQLFSSSNNFSSLAMGLISKRVGTSFFSLSFLALNQESGGFKLLVGRKKAHKHVDSGSGEKNKINIFHLFWQLEWLIMQKNYDEWRIHRWVQLYPGSTLSSTQELKSKKSRLF